MHVNDAGNDGEPGAVNHLETLGVAADHTIPHHQVALAVNARGGVENAGPADDHVGRVTRALRQAHSGIGCVLDGHAASSVTPGALGAPALSSVSTS